MHKMCSLPWLDVALIGSHLSHYGWLADETEWFAADTFFPLEQQLLLSYPTQTNKRKQALKRQISLRRFNQKSVCE